MKNIHILSTDKPSRLLINREDTLVLTSNYYSSSNPQNIYITSDEEIKEGDYFIAYSVTIDKKPYISCASEYKEHKKEKGKIILTTDVDLIKDGVQAIDDEFLEWFVKNPSCEEVEVKKESQFYRSGPLDKLGYSVVSYKIIIPEKITRCCGRCNGVDDLCYTDMCCDDHHEYGCEICYGKRVEYKIDIPIEDWLLNNPQCKQIESCSKSLSKKCICTKEEPKQETLEEAKAQAWIDFAKTNKDVDMYSFVIGYDKGAKWQQKQDKKMYSEEEHTDILEVGQILVNEETLEYGLLQYIKICLECNNESQAIRLLEKYGFEKQEERYSEEEVLEHLNHLMMMVSSKLDEFTDDEEMLTMKWFEQFKKK